LEGSGLFIQELTPNWNWAGARGFSPWPWLIVSLIFAVLAFSVRAANRSGAIAGFALCFFLCASGGFPVFAALIAVFVMAWLTTKIGYQRKVRLGTAEKTGGRNALQVLANLGVASFCAILYAVSGKEIFLLAIAAALSEAAADTVSSEVGQLSSEKVRLVTTWRAVPVGTDGGVTVLGTLSGLAAAIVVSMVCAYGGIVAWNRIWIPILAAFCGTIADSFLGALLERRKILNNDFVNFLGTLVAALIAVIA
jgi:uncharacterized protein (TIGR00297 family)